MGTSNLSSTNSFTLSVPFVAATTTVAGTAGAVPAEQVNASSEYRILTNQGLPWQTAAQVKAAVLPTTLARVVATNSSGQSIPSSVTTNITNWTGILDATANFNATTGTFTCPRAGQYQVSLNIRYASAAWTAGNLITAEIYKNGTFYASGLSQTAAVTAPAGSVVSLLLDCAAGDTINPTTFQGNAAARTLALSGVQNTFSIYEVPTLA